MKTIGAKAIIVVIPLVAILALGALLAVGASDPTVPLDGRGGGVIAFCYQALYGPPPVHRIYAINADGSGTRPLFQAPVGLNHYDWSPDGTRIAAVGYVDDHTQSIYTMALETSTLTRLTSTTGVLDCSPAWSPDRDLIAFSRVYPAQGQRAELWVMDSSGANAHSIGVESYAVHWSPDGSRLLYTTAQDGNDDVYTCRPDGTDVQRVTTSAISEGMPTWSPDGRQIAFMASADGSYGAYEIYVMDADGTDVRQLTHNTSYDGCPRWSPDGSLVAFESDLSRADHFEVYVMHPDGSDLRQVTHMASNVTAVQPAWRPVTSP